MMRYRLNEAEIVVPDGWQDHSINTFLLPASSEGAALSRRVDWVIIVPCRCRSMPP